MSAAAAQFREARERELWLVYLTALDRARAEERRAGRLVTLEMRLATVEAEIAERSQFAALLRAKAAS